MPYFLDGNNLIGHARRTARPGEEDRSAFLAELAGRLRSTRSTVRVFFDGEGKAASFGSLTISGAGGSADEAILRDLRKAADARQVTVVTADRDLARRARETGAKTMSPADFWKAFGAAARNDSRKPEVRVDVDEWLDYFADPKNRESDG
jgi:hypothetical protein